MNTNKPITKQYDAADPHQQGGGMVEDVRQRITDIIHSGLDVVSTIDELTELFITQPLPSHPSVEQMAEALNPSNVIDCYNKYIGLLAGELFEFRKLAKEIHSWAKESSIEKKVKALDRLETEFYQLSITPESAEIIDARKKLADALQALSTTSNQ